MRRRFIACLAVSADGFLARPDGDVEWLNRPEPKGGYGMRAFMRSIDTIVMGRRTYDVARRLGHRFDPGIKHYVISRRKRKPGEHVEFVSGNVARFAARLRRQGRKHVWLMGGGELFAAFLEAGAIDELIIYVVPVLIGEGVPLLAPDWRAVDLTLQSTRRYRDGVVRLRYTVV